MGRAVQLALDIDEEVKPHGGALSVGRRKTRRPFSRRQSVHVTMRASDARGPMSFLQPLNRRFIARTLSRFAAVWGVRIYEQAITSNHLHLLIRAKDRRGFQNFLRSVTGTIALKITKSRKGKKLTKRFWDLPSFSRLVTWGRDFLRTRGYVKQNQLEADNVIPYTPRKRTRHALMAMPPS